MSVGNLFNEAWYLENNPDVREAVEQGIISAWDHFNLYGRFESRAPSPLFDPEYYLAQNPDVAAAVRAGVGTAYDHFMQYGINEARSFVSFFDVNFYLSTNSDVSNAAGGDPSIGIMHFLMHGQGEPRAISPFFDLRAYLDANPDVADAVEQLNASPLEHLLTHGLNEPRDLGNGINLAQFANDPVFNNAGSPMEALARIAEVAPFLPSFEPPAGWEPPANTPIPTNFVPVDGEKLVIPPSVDVPDDVETPEDVFEPVEPGPGPQPEPEEPTPVLPGKTYIITADVAEYEGTPRSDTFNANASDVIRDGLNIKGLGGIDTLNIRAGAINNSGDTKPAPTLNGVEIVNNMHVGPAIGNVAEAVWLDLSNTTGLTRLWTDFDDVTWESGHPEQGRYGDNKVTAGVGVFYDNASFGSTVYGVKNVNPVELNAGDTYAGHANVSFNGKGVDKTLKLRLKNNDENSFYRVGQNDNFAGYDIYVESDSGGTLAISDTVKHITINGSGNLAIRARDFGELTKVNATGARGDIHFGKTDGAAKTLGLAENFEILLGSGSDTLDLSTVKSSGTVDAGKGNDTLTIGDGHIVKGGAGADTFIISADAKKSSVITIQDYSFAEGDIIDLTHVKNLDLDDIEIRGATHDGENWDWDGYEGNDVGIWFGDDIAHVHLVGARSQTMKFAVNKGLVGQILDGLDADIYKTMLVNIADNGMIRADDSPQILVGGDGSQTLRGGDGSDVLIGGKGSDLFFLDAGYGIDDRSEEQDIILDFGNGDDLIAVSSILGADVILDESAAKKIMKAGQWTVEENVLTIATNNVEGTPTTVSIVLIGVSADDIYAYTSDGAQYFAHSRFKPDGTEGI